MLVCIPILVTGMLRVRRHYTKVRENLKIETGLESLIVREAITKHVIVPVQTINKSFIKSLNCALTLGENIEVYHVSTDEEVTKKLIEKYNKLGIAAQLVIEKCAIQKC